jgi:hypothetical protein
VRYSGWYVRAIKWNESVAAPLDEDARTARQDGNGFTAFVHMILKFRAALEGGHPGAESSGSELAGNKAP